MQSSSFHLIKTVLRTSLCKCRVHNHEILKSMRCLGTQRLYSTEPLPLPNEASEKAFSPKIQKIVEDISQLNLLEVADLNELLKKTLNIADAPMMAMGMAQASSEVKVEEEEEIAAPQKTTFNVKLTGFDPDKKVALIKEIKSLIPGTNLVQAKKFVESTPVNVKTDLIKDEADQLLKALESAGGKAIIE